MALSSSQHILLAASLALCLCFLVPKLIGGGGDTANKDARKVTPPFRGHSHKESPGKSHMHPTGSGKNLNKMDHIKRTMEQELKSEKVGGSRSMAFTLMPLYAVGVALFAAYKFAKINSSEKSKSKTLEEDDKKAKQTETQLIELERHLSQTEQMLNSLLTQLDPLSNCVSSLAADQKNEIMNQLQSIRQLMKQSGMDKSGLRNSANQTCDNTLEDLIDSFKTQQLDVHENDNESKSEESQEIEDTDITAHKPVTEQSSLDPCEEEDIVQSEDASSGGLRKRNVLA